MKRILITIDTEGDNLWKWRLGDAITTENAKYLPRFQELCENYGFIPTYLTNYEMARDVFFADYFKKKSLDGKCEIGMHLHAWNSPPDFELPVRTDVIPGQPFLIEYPDEIMEEKISYMTDLLENTFEKKILVHRAGRWATDERYFRLLDKYGYKVDCSVTPGIDWSGAAGQSPDSKCNDYSSAPTEPYPIDGTGIVEIPVSVRENHRVKIGKSAGIRKTIRKYFEAKKGHGPVWLRPRNSSDNLQDMMYLTDIISKEKKTDYIMFMIHSSELMPGGSPSFPDQESIERLYTNLDVLFKKLGEGFCGSSLYDYYEKRKQQ